VLHKIQPHNGIDYGAPTGTPIYAVYKGKLARRPWWALRQHGRHQHANGIESGYCHMHKIAPGLKIGIRSARAKSLAKWVRPGARPALISTSDQARRKVLSRR
jgi:hypothetical protein